MKKFLLGTLAATMMLSTSVFAAEPTFVEGTQTPVLISAPITAQPISAVYNPHIFKTSEYATIKVAPDMATVNVYINNRAATAAEAKALNDKAVKEMTANLVASNLVTDKQISTTNFYIYPIYNYDYTTDTQTEDGYRAETNISVTVSDLSKLNSVFDKVLETTSTSISYTTFETSKYEDYYNEALVKAINKAQTRANYIADLVFGGTAQVTEISTYGTGGYYYANESMTSANLKSSDSINYVPNTIDVSAQAELTFNIQ